MDKNKVTLDETKKFGRVLLSLKDKVQELQVTLRQKHVEFNVMANRSDGPSSLKSLPKPNFNRLPSQAKSVTDLQKATDNYTDIKLSFENLTSALIMADRAIAISQGFQLDDKGVSHCSQEEIDYLKSLLEDQQDITLRIIDVEEQRMEKEVELRDIKLDVLKQDKIMMEIFPDLNQADEDGMDSRISEGLNNNMVKKKEILNKEISRVNQIRLLIQKLVIATPMDQFDEKTLKKQNTMLSRCGYTAAELIEKDKDLKA